MSDPGATIYLKDWLTMAALVAGPILAVWWTLHHQDRVQKRAAKERLFLTLMAHRKSNPPTADWATSLNLIDVVFADNPRIVGRWHNLYMVLTTDPVNEQRYTHGYLELMADMATDLGYKTLTQTDIDKFYSPNAHRDQILLNTEMQQELIRVLKATERLTVVPRKDS